MWVRVWAVSGLCPAVGCLCFRRALAGSLGPDRESVQRVVRVAGGVVGEGVAGDALGDVVGEGVGAASVGVVDGVFRDALVARVLWLMVLGVCLFLLWGRLGGLLVYQLWCRWSPLVSEVAGGNADGWVALVMVLLMPLAWVV